MLGLVSIFGEGNRNREKGIERERKGKERKDCAKAKGRNWRMEFRGGSLRTPFALGVIDDAFARLKSTNMQYIK